MSDEDVTLLTGVIVTALGLLAFLGTIGSLSLRVWVRERRAVARGTLPASVHFSSPRTRKYAVWLVCDDGAPEAAARATRCAVSTGAWLDGRHQSLSMHDDRTATVGRFDAPGGAVELTLSGPAGVRYLVARAGRGDGFAEIIVAVFAISAFYGGLALTAFALIQRFIL